MTQHWKSDEQSLDALPVIVVCTAGYDLHLTTLSHCFVIAVLATLSIRNNNICLMSRNCTDSTGKVYIKLLTRMIIDANNLEL